MKKLIIVISILPVCATFAQTNWTFQWHGQERGILFAQTNLTKSVKAAIRDDIAQVMSNVAVSNTEIHPIQPDDPDYGEIDGLMNIISKRHICPNGFRIGDYRTINGTPFFLLSEEFCSAYASAVTLTNQYAKQLSKLPALIQQFTNGLNVAGMTLKQKEAYIWHPYLDEQKKRNKAEYEAHISEGLPKEANLITVFNPSVLSYSKLDIEENGKPLLVCKLYVTLNTPTPKVPDTFMFVFRNGAWRWCPDIL